MLTSKAEKGKTQSRAAANQCSKPAEANTALKADPEKILQNKLQAMADAAPQNKQAAQLQIIADEFSGKKNKHITQKQSTPLNGAGVVQKFDVTQAGFDAAIKAVEYSGMSATMIAGGYEPILDEDQKKAIGHLRELKHLFRYKEQLDKRSKTRKYVAEALGLISNIDPTGITGALAKIENAVAKMQLAKQMYNEYKTGSARPLAGTGAASAGDNYGTSQHL